MFYKITVQDHIRVPPELFGEPVENAILSRVKKQYEGVVSKELGAVIDISRVLEVGEGMLIAGDGAAYYNTTFEILTFKPELKEVVYGKVKDIADFGAFISMGAMDGMVHISQTMDDFVSFSKEKVLVGKDSKRMLKPGDLCKARIIAVSFKEPNNPKIGLTMRQPGLGKIETEAEKAASKKTEQESKEAKAHKKEKKSGKSEKSEQ
ncbi:MAG: DNA-directed RNA polymerase [Candidatus Woesearchaeota archaeon]|nr:DNA-directed RNA polymerase [Candidatus Woesearchaeota archaeon]